jgi:hypothetical protein
MAEYVREDAPGALLTSGFGRVPDGAQSERKAHQQFLWISGSLSVGLVDL